MPSLYLLCGIVHLRPPRFEKTAMLQLYLTSRLSTTTSLPVCPQLCHSLSGNNYVTSFPVRQQLYATSCPPRSYTPLPVRQEAICHFLSANKLYATSCPPRSYMSLSLPAHNYILPPTAISSRPQLYVAVSPTHHLLIKSAIPQQYTSQFPLATAAQKTAIVL